MSEVIFPGMSLHHIGIVVNNINKAVDQYSIITKGNLTFSYEYIDSQLVDICLVKSENSVIVEFICPTHEISPVYTFSQNGGGLHHLCYEVDDLYSSVLYLKPYMRQILKPVRGFENRLITFLWTKNQKLGFSLVELAERIKS